MADDDRVQFRPEVGSAWAVQVVLRKGGGGSLVEVSEQVELRVYERRAHGKHVGVVKWGVDREAPKSDIARRVPSMPFSLGNCIIS